MRNSQTKLSVYKISAEFLIQSYSLQTLSQTSKEEEEAKLLVMVPFLPSIASYTITVVLQKTEWTFCAMNHKQTT